MKKNKKNKREEALFRSYDDEQNIVGDVEVPNNVDQTSLGNAATSISVP